MASRALRSLPRQWRYALQPLASQQYRRHLTSAWASQPAISTSRRHANLMDNSTRFASGQATGGKPFEKVLVANRGEIACRVFRTCKEMGIKTVAVYSQADQSALHVREADEAVCIGPAPSNQSYLNIEAVVDAVKQTGANAVHPGYGFLSENKKFAARLADEGVAFIGPGSFAIHAMGDKIESKKIAKEANVNVIPGFDGVVENTDDAIRLANEIGYPVMLKASAGGGGKGMRVVYDDSQCKEGFDLATAEAKSSFNDHRLLIEKFIEEPRHIEIQVLADNHGNCIYLNERECSIQRRNQKVIEEAPSTFLTPETRRAMGEQAIALARAVKYCSAGTVEFLVDNKRNFYFLEMNTRLQVEHPITECITGVDLVSEMLRVAAGLPLTVTQDDIGIKGWAVESRVYAEDPKRFLPSPGHLRMCREPDVRVDTGVKEGSTISMFYDPMISKVVTHGATRDEAIASMIDALDNYVIRGVKNNVSILRDVLHHPRFKEGDISTNFLVEEYPKGFDGHVLTDQETNELAVTAAILEARRLQRYNLALHRDYHKIPDLDEDGPLDPFRLVVCIGDKRLTVSYYANEGTKFFVGSQEVDICLHDASSEEQAADSGSAGTPDYSVSTPPEYGIEMLGSDPRMVFMIDGKKTTFQFVERKGTQWSLQHCGTVYDVNVLTEREAEVVQHIPAKSKESALKKLSAPLTGKIVSVNVQPGDTVGEDEAMAVLEAMKMQDVLRSPGDFKVKAVFCEPNQVVQEGDLLIEFE
ncbi:biotin carboxylase 1-like [Sycon ciliatum]|uniref:biotin carboxylase 1-like n=1 Tax=Sycon ciliatum TaxID=27933 RepID=UPI0020A9A67F|eukprot:scpid54508/ scgid23600/ Propionyl-CoA carboxylase alpha chain, mitochondrial; Propanoyl-CoA:carbon dioxide ligase subunit alpha